MTYHLQFGALLPYWHVLLQGLIFTIVLTVVSTVAGVAVGTAGASARTFGPVWPARVVVRPSLELIRNTRSSCNCFSSISGCRRQAKYRSGCRVLAMTSTWALTRQIIRAGIEAVPKRDMSRRKPGDEQIGGAAPRRTQTGVPQDLSGIVVACHYCDVGFRGGVADFGRDLIYGQVHPVAHLPCLRDLPGSSGVHEQGPPRHVFAAPKTLELQQFIGSFA